MKAITLDNLIEGNTKPKVRGISCLQISGEFYDLEFMEDVTELAVLIVKDYFYDSTGKKGTDLFYTLRSNGDKSIWRGFWEV